jgi:polyisoprenoid-binding protein YceI
MQYIVLKIFFNRVIEHLSFGAVSLAQQTKLKRMTMKKIFGVFFLAGLMMAGIYSCGGPSGDKVQSGEAQDAAAGSGEAYTVDVASSVIEWQGAKVAYGHNGTIGLSSGSLMVNGDQITGGEFTIDMNSIVCLDIEDPEKNAQFVGHMKSADFFETETYPTAKFVVTSAQKGEGNMQQITGNLTMKDATRSITFNTELSLNGNSVSAVTPQFVIDRSEWNVRFGSPSFFNDLKDDMIKDEIGLVVKLNASK